MVLPLLAKQFPVFSGRRFESYTLRQSRKRVLKREKLSIGLLRAEQWIVNPHKRPMADDKIQRGGIYGKLA